MFRSIDAELAVQARAKGLNLIIDDCSFTARTDADLLSQLVLNVVANAIRYTHEGAVRLSCYADADQIRIVVQDTGRGIPEDQREAIFDELYQVDRATSNGGLGLGLSIVKRIASLLGARIEVESRVGAGSTFSVTVARGDDALSRPGLDMVSAVRRKLLREVPAILVTGDTSPSVGDIMIAGVEAMSKPVDTNRLLSIVENLIAGAPRAGRTGHVSGELECNG